MKHIKYILLTLIFMTPYMISSSQKLDKPVKIAVTKASANYLNWIKKGDALIIPVDMYPLGLSVSLSALNECSGLLVTGGEDVDPSFYGKSSEKGLCKEIDPYRDTLEITLIRKALEMKIPVLGICRGEQVLNVALGGTLIVDIPTYFKTKAGSLKPVAAHECDDYIKCYHSVTVFPGTLLHSVVSCDSGFVSSNHHQAVDRLGKGLRCSTLSPDGLIEGIEWEDPQGKSFLLGVQWHPERMDTSNAFSGNVLKKFLSVCNQYHVTQNSQ
jgi:putative glutamine amidotransferase